jgi:hypothetical protein
MSLVRDMHSVKAIVNTVKDIKSTVQDGQARLPDSSKIIASSNGFFKDRNYSYVYKKSERVVTAVHIVTNFISQNEPIRVRLREKAIQLLSDVIAIRVSGTGLSEQALSGSLVEIVSLISSAQASGYVSAMNAGLIREELEHLADFIKEHREGLKIGAGALEQGDMALPESQPEQAAPVKRETQNKRTRQNKMSFIKNEKRTERRSEILKIFDSKDRISVRDVIRSMPEVGEKTLQREMLALVSEGVLVKEGERRWSTYTMRKRQ